MVRLLGYADECRSTTLWIKPGPWFLVIATIAVGTHLDPPIPNPARFADSRSMGY